MAVALKQGVTHQVIHANIEQLVETGIDRKDAAALAYREAGREAMDFQDADSATAREENHLGYLLVRDNPIIRAGVFQYRGSMIGHGADPNQVYNVYRPLEELTRPETIQSFIGLPIIDEHEMLGGKYPRSPEERGVHGAILENIRAAGLDILAPIRIFSRSLKALIDAGKRGLSLGYNCAFEKSSGVFDGIAYNYIQRGIRGNHLALVVQGRNGTAVLDEHDVLDHFDLALDTGELTMAGDNEDKATDDKGAAGAIDLAACHKFMTENAPMWKELQALMAGTTATEGDDTALDEDTKEKAGDQKAEDEDDDKKDSKEEKKEAMDSADVNALLDRRLAAERKTIRKSIMADVTNRNALAKSLEPHIGSFAFDHMDTDEVAAYGAEKLGIKVAKGHEQIAISAFLQGKNAAGGASFAMDSAMAPKPKADSKLGKRLAGANA